MRLGRKSRQQALRLIRDCHCLVLNSNSEGYPMVIPEAMAQETPVIASCIGSTGEMLSDGVYALLFARGDYEALTDCLFRMDRDSTMADTFGSQVNAGYEQFATLDSVLSRYFALYSN